jgi:8-oxo-dGTP pyrophosphatase MutT (NUDIX family)
VTQYVAGFLINRNDQTVALILKTKPRWQCGLLNAIGGKIENGESPRAAMAREFEEETGAKIADWERFCILSGKNDEGEEWTVHFFRAFTTQLMYADVPYAGLSTLRLRSLTEERVYVTSFSVVSTELAIPNLMWLIPMALYIDKERAEEFNIQEFYEEQESAGANG